MAKSVKKIVDHEAYKRAKERSGLSVEQIVQSTGLVLPMIKALDEHGIILTDDAMLKVAQCLRVSVYDLVKRLQY